MYANFAAVLVFIALGVVFVFGSLLFGLLIRPRRPTPTKTDIYECGEPTIGSAWIRYNSRFYSIALVYLLFDVEVVVLVPTMLVLKEFKLGGYGVAALIALLAFLFVLTLGLAYEWFYGNLDWIRHDDRADAEAQSPVAARPGATQVPVRPAAEPARESEASTSKI